MLFHAGVSTGEREKVILFTEYRDTHHFLMKFLRESGYANPIATLTGAMTREQRSAELETFAQPETMLLLATDAASEGLNLQEHCRVIIHYELPWNPNRLEQRNGRVYRWGQQRDVIAYNLTYADTYDAHVLDILLEKSQQIREDLGSASDVIGVMESISWEELLMESPRAQAADPADVERARERIEKEVSEARRRLLAWRDTELGQSQRFEHDERHDVERARKHGSDRRLTVEERKRIVEWIVPLCGGRIISNADGTTTIEVPQALRRHVPQRIEAASYAYNESLRGRDVEVLGMHHPLLTACGVTARAAIYDGASPFVAQRIAAKVADTANAGVLYTFLARYVCGDGSTFTEEIVPIFSPFGLPCSEDTVTDEAILTASPLPGSLNSDSLVIRRLLQAVDVNHGSAEGEALRRTHLRSISFETEERERTNVMRSCPRAWCKSLRSSGRLTLSRQSRRRAGAPDCR